MQLGILEHNTWLLRALNGKTIVFSKDIAHKFTTLTYGKDVAISMAKLVGNPRALGRIIQITCNTSLKWSDVLDIYTEEIENFTGHPVKVKLLENAPIDIFSSERWTLKYDRLFDRRFYSDNLDVIIGEKQDFVSPKVGLRKCIQEFMHKPNYNGFSPYYEAKIDRITGEISSYKEFQNIKRFIKYLRYRFF